MKLEYLGWIFSAILLIYAMYSDIKYVCLKKASEMIAKAEKEDELTGEEKLALVITWITDGLPSIFSNELFKGFIKYIINFVYNNSFDYMKNYVKRKTGKDISTIINEIASKEDNSK